ncbi:homocysteine S-methyltransferase family protein [Tuwongella immobilis]|uniref:Hcy-binding domain-containing protein n=1 Tax=Tuwongella immobilis TaxID=692036 RepID=A0A6C2YJ68_9BACT|nr:homocysteine S-methyltransferase family protein [Tuwongella immobilis]VIP01598.1 5-methyltetrahydrofolate--homocysteine methyltransferase : Putative 5-methyltetrahydrofolate--homocysteine methyltransferase OS=Anaerotruncus sp. CAG:528 GN=BN695_01354 PE=4 SV=1: S-methyl_trans: S-methyl_trans [Tuwongella immobilis]VTR98883.1 5-methyltetrahydrofolate--homocysteine methyltransferase : Putative 5-methyltetrahydrofolate--homocysteine methyltransferase OS=Anaerotruncus sp. CAG:528 GN=BN695_01354 PE=4
MGTAVIDATGCRPEAVGETIDSHPEIVRAIHTAHRQAGAECLLTATFHLAAQIGGSSWRNSNWYQQIRQSIECAQAAGSSQIVLAFGPIGELPDSPADWLDALPPTDALLFETLTMREHLENALQLIATDRPTWISASFRKRDDGRIETWDGLSPAQVAQMATASGVAAIGTNCGFEIDAPAMCEIVRQYREQTDRPILARLNAGSPSWTEGGWWYPLSPQGFAKAVLQLREAGADSVGGCCGVTAQHLTIARKWAT